MGTHYDLLNSPVEYLKGVGPQRADVLKKELGIFTFGDLLFHFPFRYVDRTKIYKVNEVNANTQYIQLRGVLKNMDTADSGKFRKRLIASLEDETGRIELVWFRNVKWIQQSLMEGKEYIVFGKPNLFRNKFSIPHPEMELAESEEKSIAGKLQPMYPSTDKLKGKGLDSKGISKIMRTLLQQITPADIKEILPQQILSHYRFPLRFEAIQQTHFPENELLLQKSQQRMKFEELFIVQLNLLLLKQGRKDTSSGFVFTNLGMFFNRFYNEKLPFELTDAQKKVIKEIRSDTLSGKQMNRLLQGDVGSGKTIVALITMLMAADNNYQACMMAPTEILSQQHFKTISKLVRDIGVNVALLTSSVKGKERKEILEGIDSGAIHILIGTHSLIEEDVKFRNLGLVIIDEQHRFGVEQRSKLWTKNHQPPHILVMTATPIPRTLALTLYGDLDVSVIDKLPPGRKQVKTLHRYDSARVAVFDFMRKEIKKGRQIYVVYPLIEESEKLDFKDLMDGYESISRSFPLPEYTVSIVHGRMKNEDKEFEMQRFSKGETNIMVATTVIEVGVDVPNASVMVIESAERFGLSQLHQLRGRVGRGAEQSYCILMTGNKLSNDARTRMETMVRTNDGFEIAEVDLQLRGAGDLSGTQQSGNILKIAELAKDQKILQVARKDAEELLNNDLHLQKPENKMLADYVNSKSGKGRHWSKIS